MIDSLDDWRPSGRVCLWRYKPMPKMYSGWHFTADADGCRVLLDLLMRLHSRQGPGHRTMAVFDPVAIGVDRIFGDHELDVRKPEKFRLAFDPDHSDSTPHIRFDDGRFVLGLGPGSLPTMANALGDLARNDADFGMTLTGPASVGMDVMNFWWWPKGQ